jgi:hypothetical protein
LTKMKSSAIVICLFLGLTQAINHENLNIQIESEAENRMQIRSQLQQELRAALSKDHVTQDLPRHILPGSVAIPHPNPAGSSDMDQSLIGVEAEIESESLSRATTRQLLQVNLRNALLSGRCVEGDCDVNEWNHSWPGPVLPGSAPIPYPNPTPSSDLDDSSLLQTAAPEFDDTTVEGARQAAALMQATMDQAVAAADAKRAAQQKDFENNVNKNDPASQLKGLMNAQQSLHRLTSAFASKPNTDKVEAMAKKLGIPMTPELMQLGNNEAISNALVEIAVGMGKTESEIGASLD